MATADVAPPLEAATSPSRASGSDPSQSSASSAQAILPPAPTITPKCPPVDSSEGEDEKISECSRDEGSRIRGGYRCSKCGLPKKGHVCPSGNGTYTNLTFVGHKETPEIVTTVETEQERRAALMRRVDFLEAEVARLTKENSQLKAALEAFQSSQGSFPYIPYVTSPITNSNLDPREYVSDYDMQPMAKRPRFDADPTPMHEYAPHAHPPHIALHAPSPAHNMDVFYDSSRMNLPVNTHITPDYPKPAKSAFVSYQSPTPHPTGPQFPSNSSSISQETLPFQPPTVNIHSPVNVNPSSGSSEHAWLRIPKPQGRPTDNTSRFS